MPYSMLPEEIRNLYRFKNVLDYGLAIQSNNIEIKDKYCILPSAKVFGYALSIAISGKPHRVLLASFDGYGIEDLRNIEINNLINNMKSLINFPLLSITPTQYNLDSVSIYAI